MLMGEGKTTVIAPVLVLLLATTSRQEREIPSTARRGRSAELTLKETLAAASLWLGGRERSFKAHGYDPAVVLQSQASVHLHASCLAGYAGSSELHPALLLSLISLPRCEL